ncbi:MAG: beta-eliminating lyase-related protein [Actinomycetota bacterium]|nr:beta-eliminating lyase-related protein [Actinomycetota bacterium]
MKREFIDLRSDTVTKPTEKMRQMMAAAVVGDDLYRDDPTVADLEELFATRVGKEAALYLPSGVMANQVAIRTHCAPGTYIIAGERQHILTYEYGGVARNAGVSFLPLKDDNGRFDGGVVVEKLTASGFYDQRVSLIAIENTHMESGGKYWRAEELRRLREAAGSTPIHLDGARLFNAHVASGMSTAEICSHVDTVMSCVSKGLSAPIGSLLAGSRDFIERARYERATLGGQMRQAGIIAAAGIVALNEMVDRLADDHQRAARLAGVIRNRVVIADARLEELETNIVIFTVTNASSFVDQLASRGIKANALDHKTIRFVTHSDLGDDDIDDAIEILNSIPQEIW